MQRNDLPVLERFVLVRDQALLKLQFFAGDQASDVGHVLVQEIKMLSDGTGLVFNHTFGKTLKGDGKFRFVIKRCDDQVVCPVGGIEHYFYDAKLYGIDLSAGYLFCPVMGSMKVLDDCMSYSAIYERLKTYLSILGIVAKLAILILIVITIGINCVPLLHRSGNSAGAVLYFSRASWS